MEKIIHHESKPKRPIGQKHRPTRPYEYDPTVDVSLHLKRMGMRDMFE